MTDDAMNEWGSEEESGLDEPYVPTPEEIDAGTVPGRRSRKGRAPGGQGEGGSRRFRGLFRLRLRKGVGEKRTESKPKIGRSPADGGKGSSAEGLAEQATDVGDHDAGVGTSAATEQSVSDPTASAVAREPVDEPEKPPEKEAPEEPRGTALRRIAKPPRRPPPPPPLDRELAPGEDGDPDQCEAQRRAGDLGHELAPLAVTPTFRDQKTTKCLRCGARGRVVREREPGWNDQATRCVYVGNVFSVQCVQTTGN